MSNIERGHVARCTVATVRAMFEALDARLQLLPQWRGAELERLADAAHAQIVAEVTRRVQRLGWTPLVEVTYSEFGERGSIDVLALQPDKRAAMIIEVKSDLASEEAAARKLDEKARLAPTIVLRRAGWTPTALASVLVVPESPRLRRRLAGSAVLARMYPIASRRIGSWLRNPRGHLAATWFLSGITPRNPRRVRSVATAGKEPLGDAISRAANGVPGSTDHLPSILR